MTAPRALKLRIDEVLCTGHGRCYMLAPEIYGEDERGHCIVLQAEIGPELEMRAELGVEACPEGALRLEDG